MLNLNYGTDPEYFAVNEEGLAISPAMLCKFSGVEILDVDREFKHPIFIEKPDWKWIMDGVAFEATYKKIFKTAKEMHETINNSLEDLEDYLSHIEFNGSKLSLYKKPVVNIKPSMYKKYLDDYVIFQGFIFGCDKDFDAIETNYQCKTLNVENHKFRYGGGHFHISGDDNLKDSFLPAVRLLAITVGNYCISKSPYKELEIQRAKTYGRPGRFRPQNYPNGDFGVEYRTPSNSWTSLDLSGKDELLYWAERAIEFLNSPELGSKVMENFLEPTIKSITTGDQELAKNILGNL